MKNPNRRWNPSQVYRCKGTDFFLLYQIFSAIFFDLSNFEYTKNTDITISSTAMGEIDFACIKTLICAMGKQCITRF